jgi:hypothetical protein
MSIVWDLWHSIVGIITTSGWITLAIGLVIAIGAAFVIEGAGSLISATIGALIVFGLATTIYHAATAKGGANWSGMPQADWAALHSVSVAPTLLAYGIIFAVAIGVLSFIRSIVLR